MTPGLVTIFGGSGFLGRHVVRALVKDGWRVRIPMRRPHTGQDLRVIGNVGQVQLVQANIRFKRSVERAIAGSDAVINLVGVLFSQGKQSFQALHVTGAETIARAAHDLGITNVIQISALGASPDAQSLYAQSKAQGEQKVRQWQPSADIIRPSILVGPEDHFFNRFASLAQFTPALPLLGGGHTSFQPSYVGDVAAAISSALKQRTSGQTYELAGPQTYTFKGLMKLMLDAIDRKRLLVPLPWFVSNMLGFTGEMVGWLPFIEPVLTRDQVASLKDNNVISGDEPGYDSLGIQPTSIEAIIPAYLERYKKYGQFHETHA